MNYSVSSIFASIVLGFGVVQTSQGAESPTAAIKTAWQALKAGNYDQAIAEYEKARALAPASAEIPYNLGIAHYRKGEFDKAAEDFKQAMTLSRDGALRSQSIYNMGNAAYAKTLESLKQKQDPSKPAEQMKEATDLLKSALDNYKKAMDTNPSDEDARANAELSHRLLKQLQEMQKQQEQQQQQSGDDQKNQDQQQKQDQQDQNGQQGKKDQSQDQKQQSKDQSQQSEQSESQKADSEDQQQDKKQSAKADDQPKDDTKEQPVASNEQKPSDEKPLAEQSKTEDKTDSQKHAMTKEEASRLLQSVRDKERKRRAELARREALKHAPAEKDW